MKLEHKVAMGLLGLVAMVGAIFYFANQPKKPAGGVTLDKPAAPTPTKTVGDKTVTGAPTASNRPAAPAVPAAKPTPGSATPKSDASLASTATPRNEPQLPPVTVAPPLRREGAATADPAKSAIGADPADNPAAPGGASPTPASPAGATGTTPTGTGTTAIPSNTPGLGGPAGATGDGEKSKSSPAGNPLDSLKPRTLTDKPDGSTLGANSVRKPISESEIERGPDAPAIADLGKKPPANSGTLMPGTRTVPGETPLTPTGSKSKEARPSRPESSPGSSVESESYTIQPGDRLATIAKQRYGSESYVKQIIELNPGLNPDRIVAGKSISLPKKNGATDASGTGAPGSTKPEFDKKTAGANDLTNNKTETARNGNGKPEAARTGDKSGNAADDKTARRADDIASKLADPGAETYVVKKGDTLRKIAKAKLGNENAWTEIFRLNKDKLKSQDGLSIGMSLRLPAVKKTESARASP